MMVGLICARGGSKGLPNKNIKPLCGLPLIAHSIMAGQNSPSIDRLFVSTDCQQIAGIAKEFQAEVPFLRPPELATDESPEWLTWQHALTNLMLPDVEALIILPPTAPLRLATDICDAIKIYRENSCDGVLTIAKANRNPLFNMVTCNKNGFLQLAVSSNNKYSRRQELPDFFDLTTVCYVLKPQFVLSKQHLFDGNLLFNQIPKSRAIDIDTEFDFEIAEFLLSKRGNHVESSGLQNNL